jgi:hypothetical protein
VVIQSICPPFFIRPLTVLCSCKPRTAQDEPTSGLDSTAAADILLALKRVAGLGMNIVTVMCALVYFIYYLLIFILNLFCPFTYDN